MTLTQAEFEQLLELRMSLRRFLNWSEQQARAAGVTPTQHQLLLAIRGHADPQGPTVGEVADYLMLRHHSAVGLIDRAVTAGLVKRTADDRNASAVRVVLTPRGNETLDALSEAHLQELAHLAPAMRLLWSAFEQDGRAPD